MDEHVRVFLVAGEPSGDELGASLMRAMRSRLGAQVSFSGLGGDAMVREGLPTLFPLSDISVMGIPQVMRRIRTIVRRAYEVVRAVVASRPDVLVIIDAPDFTHAIAKRVARRMPGLPIVNYVSPTVWAWRPGRAAKMRGYITHVMALKPFEPAAHLRLGGPPCTYVGHPLIERLAELRPRPGDRSALDEGPLRLVILPGSRRSEITRLMEPFGEALRLVIARSGREVEVTLPAVAHLVDDIRERTRAWPVTPLIVEGEEAKHAAFRRAHVALAASGTVTLELALAGVPMVVAYKISWAEGQLRFLLKVPSIVLANLVVEENVVSEYIQEECTPENLADDLLGLASDTPARRRQVEAFAKLDRIMEADAATTPSERAADLVLEVVAASRAGRPATAAA